MLKNDLEQIENEIILVSSQIKYEKIKGHLNLLTDGTESLSRVNMWQLKRSVCQDKYSDRPSAKYNEKGQLITSQSELLNLYSETYQSRLAHRKIEEEYESLERFKSFLFNLRLSLAKGRKTMPWSEENLSTVLKGLKPRKCPDPIGMTYEVFKPGVRLIQVLARIL